MKMYLACDVGKQWRVGLSKPRWRSSRFGFEMESDDVSICTEVAEYMVEQLGFNPDKMKAGEWLECDLT